MDGEPSTRFLIRHNDDFELRDYYFERHNKLKTHPIVVERQLPDPACQDILQSEFPTFHSFLRMDPAPGQNTDAEGSLTGSLICGYFINCETGDCDSPRVSTDPASVKVKLEVARRIFDDPDIATLFILDCWRPTTLSRFYKDYSPKQRVQHHLRLGCFQKDDSQHYQSLREDYCTDWLREAKRCQVSDPGDLALSFSGPWYDFEGLKSIVSGLGHFTDIVPLFRPMREDTPICREIELDHIHGRRRFFSMELYMIDSLGRITCREPILKVPNGPVFDKMKELGVTGVSLLPPGVLWADAVASQFVFSRSSLPAWTRSVIDLFRR